MARIRLPSHLISILSEELSASETHATMDSLFMYANAPGDPPEGSKLIKAQTWLRRINTDENCDPLEVVGYLIEGYMEPPLKKLAPWDDEPYLSEPQSERMARINGALARAGLQYIPGAKISHISGSAGTVGRSAGLCGVRYPSNLATDHDRVRPRGRSEPQV